jgi:hypothetical protein
MTLADLITTARKQFDDVEGGSARLISDEEFAYFADDAQERICEVVLPIEDSTTTVDADGNPVCVIPVVAGTTTYPLHPKIIQIMRVMYDGVDYPLTLMSTAILDSVRPGWQSDTQDPDGYILDDSSWSIRLNRIPSTASNIRLIVKRMPLVTLSATDLTASPEIPSIYHKTLIDWMLHSAYMKQDVETYNPVKAEQYLARFVAGIEQIRRTQIRRKPRTILGLRSYW